jgi:catechol 2,3-dioxygenase-like lactoylglutathione lyase family enzyme
VLDHISLPAADLQRAAAFYDAVLGTLGLQRRKESARAIGFGASGAVAPCFWVLQSAEKKAASPGMGLHVSFAAPTRAAVDAFHACALKAGGKDAGAPGLRPEYSQSFYGAFVRDLDGFKIEAVCRAP